ncbi:MAG: hypothetical protein K940chlam9_00347 [Chlamydiae bacterium]|nr:hypothetical protein [Chlamydiota bacterium]
MRSDELAKNLALYLDPETIADYCPNGLQVEGGREIKRVATAVSANLQTIEEAAKLEVDALVTHHGMFWNRDPYPVVGSKREKIALLLEKGISLFAYHLPLDAHLEVGNNWKAARDLGWENLAPFGLFNGIKIGVRGEIPLQSIDSFVAKVEEYYDHKSARALFGKERISKVALVSGGAYTELSAAAAEGIDCFITGNYDEPAWGIAYEEKVHFLALGHAATEKVGPKALAAALQEKWGLDAFFLDIHNPF